jgi:tripartite-type tricarboxylate transporter receptor subunit TctC
MTPRLTAAAALAALLLQLTSAPLAQAQKQGQDQAWPQRSVKFIVPLGPGSGVDVTARVLANQLSARWGKPVVVENRPGGDGFVAISAFTGARDDHTLLFTPTSTFTGHPFLHDKLPYDPADLVPVARVTATLAGVGATASLNVNTLPELVALARAEPGKLNWAGITGALDLAFAGFLKSADLNINKIPYRDGVQAVNDLAEGRIQVYLTALAIIRPHIERGKVKLIVMANQERAPSMPNVQTAIEAGYPKLTFDGLVGLFGLRGVTEEAHVKVAADVQAVMTDPAIVKQLEANNQLVRYGNARQFAAAIDAQRAQIATAAESLGIKASR